MSDFLIGKQKALISIECLIADAGTASVLVPMSAVAEVIHDQQVEPDPSAPVWMAGWLEWRKLRIPVLEFFAVQENRTAQNFEEHTKLMVMQSFEEGHGSRYYAVYTRDFPRILKLQDDSELATADNSINENCIEMTVALGDQAMHLPNFSTLEQHLQQIPAQRH